MRVMRDPFLSKPDFLSNPRDSSLRGAPVPSWLELDLKDSLKEGRKDGNIFGHLLCATQEVAVTVLILQVGNLRVREMLGTKTHSRIGI